MTIRVIIVDDEPLAREGVLLRLQQQADIEVIAQCGDGSEAIRSILSLKPDLVFLDIQMPKVTGFDVVTAVGPELMPPVIFLTAYNEHAIDAFRIHAIDYLLKPIEDDRFQESLNHAREQILKHKISQRSQQLSELLNSVTTTRTVAQADDAATEKTATQMNDATIATSPEERLVIRANGHVYFLRSEDVYWVEADGDYVSIHTPQKVHLVRETMKNMEKRLAPQGFQRVHRSAIVNLNYVRELIAQDSGDYQIVLQGDARVKLSRNYRDALCDRLNTVP